MRPAASREEWRGKVIDDRIGDRSHGGALLEFPNAGCPDCRGEEPWKLRADASWRGCRAGGLWELWVGGDWLDWNGASRTGCGGEGG